MDLEPLRPTIFVAVRLAAFASHGLLFGLLPLVLAVMTPALTTSDPSSRSEVAPRLALALERVVRVCLVVSLGSTVCALFLQTTEAAALRGEGLGWGAIGAVLETSFGRWYASRILLAAGLAIVLLGRVRELPLGARPGRASSLVWYAAWGVLAVGLLATSSLSGHAAAADAPAVAVANDVVHLAAGGAWFAGIFTLARVLPRTVPSGPRRDHSRLFTGVVARFSNFALAAIALATATGVVNSFLDVGRLRDLVVTPYGHALLTKLWVFAWILLVGAVNHFWLRRKLIRSSEQESPRAALGTLQMTVGLELVFAFVLLGATAILVGLPKTG